MIVKKGPCEITVNRHNALTAYNKYSNLSLTNIFFAPLYTLMCIINRQYEHFHLHLWLFLERADNDLIKGFCSFFLSSQYIIPMGSLYLPLLPLAFILLVRCCTKHICFQLVCSLSTTRRLLWNHSLWYHYC